MAAICCITSNGYGFLIDAADEAEVTQHRWYFNMRGGGYVQRIVRSKRTRCGKSAITLHRQLMRTVGTSLLVDHVNGNTSDYRRGNLRTCSYAENSRNRAKNRGQTFKGVTCVLGDGGRVMFKASLAGKCGHAVYTNAADAALAYDVSARRAFGEFARTNFSVVPKRIPTPTAARKPRSGFRGVYPVKNGYQACLRGKHLGFFMNPILAAKKYDSAAVAAFGEKAKINFSPNPIEATPG